GGLRFGRLGMVFLAAAVAVAPAWSGGSAPGGSGGAESAFFQELKHVDEQSEAGHTAEALAAYQQLLQQATRAGRLDWRARVLRERGVTYLSQNALEDARADFKASVALSLQLGDHVEAAKTRLRLAEMLAGSDPEAAGRMLERIEKDLAGGVDPETLRFVQLHRARIQVMAGRPNEALPILEELQAHYLRQGRRHRLADVLSLQSYALQKLGRWESSMKAYRRLIEVAFENGNQNLVTYAYCNLGEVEQKLGLHKVADSHLDRAIRSLDGLRARIPGGARERLTYLDAQVSAYDRKMESLIDFRRDPEAALVLSERFHGRTLQEELRSPAGAGGGSPLSLEEHELLQDLMELQERLVRQGLDEAGLARLGDLEKRWEAAGRSRRRGSPAPRSVERSPSLGEIQKTLPPGAALMIYWVHPDRVWLWVMRSGSIRLVQTPVGRRKLRDMISRYLEPIRDRVRAEDLEVRGGEAEHLALGGELYRLLIQPARPMLKEIEHLIIVPDDALWRLPLETLVVEESEPPAEGKAEGPPLKAPAPERLEAGAGGRAWFEMYARIHYLLEDYSFLYVQSATVWASLAGRVSRGSGLLAVAPSLAGSAAARERGWRLAPLPTAAREVSSLGDLVTPSRVLAGSGASEARIKEILPGYRFVHFATHGYLREDRPRLSGIFLQPGDGEAGKAPQEDGLLQGFEVAGLPLHAELVSLAACDSGLGQVSRAEGMVGLARAFLVAGARNVLVSMWPVDDRASGRLMESFYRALKEGRTLPQSLRRAKLDLLRETVVDTVVSGGERVSLAHPYFWAAYVQVGGDDLSRALVPRQPGGPVEDQGEGQAVTGAERGVDQKPLPIGRDVIGAEDGRGALSDEQSPGAAHLDRRSLDGDRNRDHLAARRHEEESGLVALPARLGAASCGGLPLAAGAGEGSDVDFLAARLVGGVGQPLAVRGKHAPAFVEGAVDHGNLAVRVRQRQGFQIESRQAVRRRGGVQKLMSVRGDIGEEGISLHFRDKLFCSGSVSRFPVDLEAAGPVGTEHQGLAVRRPAGAAVDGGVEREARPHAPLQIMEPDVPVG
ncbi:MAG: CHAT domain-containing protein, partial [Acidobacteriota bacterium]